MRRDARYERFLAAARPYWHPVARSDDVPAGTVVPVQLLGEELALWRGPDGHLGLVEDLCAHRGTRLSAGSVSEAGCVVCPYHAWEYEASGACTRIPQLPGGPVPGRARTHGYDIDEYLGLVWACLAPPPERRRDRPRFPGAEAPELRRYAGEPKDWDCQSGRQIENFCDLAHFSVLHADVFGNPDAMEVEPFTVHRSDDGWSLEWEYTYPARDPIAALQGGDATKVKPLDIHYRIELPFTVSLASSDTDQEGVLVAANQPLSATTSRLYWVYAVTASALEAPDEILEAGQDAVMSSDRRVVAGQRPERLPLDLAAELHLPFDRQAVAYRRALAELGFPSEYGSEAGAPVAPARSG